MVQLKISIEKRHLFLISAVFVFLVGIVIVISYGDFSSGVPSTLGHSSDEVNVKIGAITKTLQQAITNKDLAGCQWLDMELYDCGTTLCKARIRKTIAKDNGFTGACYYDRFSGTSDIFIGTLSFGDNMGYYYCGWTYVGPSDTNYDEYEVITTKDGYLWGAVKAGGVAKYYVCK